MYVLAECEVCNGRALRFEATRVSTCSGCDGRGFNYQYRPAPAVKVEVASDTGSQQVA